MSADVVIAGAGPAGVATAVALVQRDPTLAGRIVVFDRARFPRAKPCGGGLTGHARTALETLGLQVRVPFVPCDEGRILFGRLACDVRMQRPVDVVRREDFDADLVAQARDRGISVLEGEGGAAARGWPAWAYPPRTEIAAPHLLCVGDAAGIDALTGEGIAVGLEHGIVAADAIVQALHARDFTFAGYRQAIRRAVVGRELALDRRLARMLYGSSFSRLWLSV